MRVPSKGGKKEQKKESQSKVQARRSKPEHGSNYVSKLSPITRDIPNKEKNGKLEKIISFEEPSLTQKRRRRRKAISLKEASLNNNKASQNRGHLSNLQSSLVSY